MLRIIVKQAGEQNAPPIFLKKNPLGIFKLKVRNIPYFRFSLRETVRFNTGLDTVESLSTVKYPCFRN